ncbi:MAG TPA: GNAT family N-acetyltransferase, partial [Actinomycetota bacterium]
ALAEMRRTGLRPDPDVVMTFGGERLPPTSSEVDVVEVPAPDPDFWPWYRDSLSEFGTELSAEVLDQMVERIRQVFLPAGLRWFVGHVEGSRAGYASMLAASGVAYIDNVVTMPGFRRRGVATAAVSAAIEASRAAGDRSIFLLAEADGCPQRLYERLGFRVRATVESYTRLLPKE